MAGTFSFEKIGMSYAEAGVPYVAMRIVPALFGLLLVPVAYATMRNFGFSTVASVLTATMVMFENSLVCVKWVGLFTIAMIGAVTIQQLWTIVTDGSIPLRVFYRHFMARVLALIVVPISIYMFFFQVHFAILNRMGPGSSFMSPEFQSGLIGSPIVESYAGGCMAGLTKDIAFGSNIMFRHEGSKGGYLHSHPHHYPAGSKQQQVTCYPHKDSNSDFLVKYPLDLQGMQPVEKEISGFDRVHHMSTIRLEHIPTNSRLHSHNIRPGFNDDKDINEVTAYGDPNSLGDANDHWVVEIEGAKDESTPLFAIKTKFRLRHVQTGCYLASRDHKLPDWAFGQQEVTCSSKARYGLTIWRVENANHPNMPEGSKKLRYSKPGFLEKFVEIHRVMWRANNGLKSSHPYDSRPGTLSCLTPDAWPLLKRGINFWRSTPDRSGIYLIGNPAVWIPASLAILLYLGYELVDLVLQKRKITFSRSGYYKDMVAGACFFTTGYILHYLPFFLMARQLFLHHYLPSLYFSILTAGALFDLLTYKLKATGQTIAALAVAAVVIFVFSLYSPLTYGLEQSQSACERLKLRSGWDWGCPAV
ncbi:hypothetical protein HDU91_005976 [Kappamyces sp. JEL0680]|nr:hypothetical protein HDU91_005976 [Kappamyces sp. JEL0680]